MASLDLGRDAALLVQGDPDPALAAVVAAWKASGRRVLTDSSFAGVRTLLIVGAASHALLRAAADCKCRTYFVSSQRRGPQYVDPAEIVDALARGTTGLAADGFPRFCLDPV